MSSARERGGVNAAADLPPEAEARASAWLEEDRDLTRVYLQPGHLFAATEPHSVTTILGSCVSICIYDSVAGVGGMNHYLLPHWAGSGVASPRFGNIAIDQLLERLRSLGGDLTRLSAKVFGGACVLEAFRDRQGHLGQRNVQIAFRLLAERGIPVVAEDVGGDRGRKLVFHTDRGNAWVRTL